MIYLNQPDDGGATRFKTIGKTIQPELGKLLAWNNLLPAEARTGDPAPGMKVRKGTKYVLTKWFRERSAA
jgi:prolyl 4-hydroxylase